MKIRWKEHELIFVSLVTIGGSVMVDPSFMKPWQVSLAQIGSFLMLFVGYLAINLAIVPLIKKISFADFETVLTLQIVKPVLVIAGVSYFLAIGANVLSYYAQPHLVHYRDFQILALFGYNDAPLSKLLFGFDRALGLVLLFTALACLRELIIWLITKPVEKRAFRIMVLNNLSPLLLIYFLIPFLINPIHSTFLNYIAWTTPVIALYVYQTFWLFPLRENRPWLSRPVLLRLFISIAIGAFFFALFFSDKSQKLGQFAGYFLFLMFIITPVCLLMYQQRKEKILELKGMETALARSKADLQFLRSQINPHFLFNALNTLYGTAMKEKSEKTAEGIQLLGDMMRFMLHDNQMDTIPLEKEIRYLENYISLQKLRLPDSSDILIEYNLDEINCNWSIAPMLLIPFVENAFKHGISFQEKSWVILRLECSDNMLSFKIRNSVHPFKKQNSEREKSGIGLQNVSQRLNLLYAERHTLSIDRDAHEFLVSLVIYKNSNDVKSNRN